MIVRAAVLGVVLAGAVGCTSSGGRDDRARVTSAVGSFATQLVSLHDIAPGASVHIGDCADGWASVSFSAPVTNATANPLDQEKNVLGAAALSTVRLDRVRDLNPPPPGEPASVFSTKDGRTQLTVTVALDRAVRIDGYVSC